MKLTAEQSTALLAINHWLTKSSAPEFVLAGYAGTGKTTLLGNFIDSQSKPVLTCAPTGKAASVLRRKLSGNARVSTVHSILYTPSTPSTDILDALKEQLIEDPTNRELQARMMEEKAALIQKKVKFNPKNETNIVPGSLIVVDEASMVSRRMREDLIATGARILFCGDAAQLPAVMSEDFFTNRKPDAMLEQITRQSAESPIIRLSMQIRLGQNLEVNETGCRRMPKAALPPTEWLRFDQIITGKNETRQKINRYIRKQKGFTRWWPFSGEKLVILKNERFDENMLINGVPAVALNDFSYNDECGEVMGSILFEGSIINGYPFYKFPFESHYNDSAKPAAWQDLSGSIQADFAHALTVHKTQGSEFDSVLLADDGMMANNLDFRRRFLYTAITRARREFVWLT